MSTLKVNKLRDTAGSADAITLDPNGGAVLAGVTTVTSVKVGAAVTISESGIEASGIGITCASINGTQIGGRRNIIINGAMNVAQRGTSSTTQTYSYVCIDRIRTGTSGTDEGVTIAQADVSSGTTPYTSGFRKCLKITNGNQTSGAGAADYIQIDYSVEAQDLANSGWNYTSSSSNITFSFWIKSSVAQAFPYAFQTQDGTSQIFNSNTPALTADTWTKVTKTISGNSNITIDNNNGSGFKIMFFPYLGTNFTTVGLAEDTWSTFTTAKYGAGATTTTWYTTDDATFEITGVQLEVGSQATAFEHRSAGDELARCKRYYNRFTAGSAYTRFADGQVQSSDQAEFTFQHPVTMRAAPTYGSGGSLKAWTENSLKTISSMALNDPNVNNCTLTATVSGCTRGYAIDFIANNDTTAYIEFISEL